MRHQPTGTFSVALWTWTAAGTLAKQIEAGRWSVAQGIYTTITTEINQEKLKKSYIDGNEMVHVHPQAQATFKSKKSIATSSTQAHNSQSLRGSHPNATPCIRHEAQRVARYGRPHTPAKPAADHGPCCPPPLHRAPVPLATGGSPIRSTHGHSSVHRAGSS